MLIDEIVVGYFVDGYFVDIKARLRSTAALHHDAAPVRSRFSVHAVIIAVCLALIGLAMAIYLVSQFHQIDGR